MDSASLLWIATAIMTAGGLVILMHGKQRTKTEQLQTVTHGIVPLIAACSAQSRSPPRPDRHEIDSRWAVVILLSGSFPAPVLTALAAIILLGFSE